TKHQRNAAQKMNQLSQQMSMNLQQMQQEQTAEDIEVLRQVLNNLVQLSFEQEKLLETTNTTNRKNPKFPELIGQQKKLKDDFSVIEDSLMALSKRQPAIKNIIHKEIAAINENMDISIDHLLSMNTVGIVPSKAKNNATSRQQYAMTSMNNLALLIAESLNQLMQQLQNQKAGNDKPCNNPGGSGGGMSMQKIRSMQESLNQQLQKMKDQMGKGQQNNGENNRNSMSEQFAKMAAKQEAIRRALQQYLDELQKQGMHEKGKLGDVLKEMEKTEEELVNKIINNQTLNRQKEIKTRLLESEKAEQEQEQEEKRESKEAKNYIFSNPKLFLEYNKLKDKEVEMLQFSSPSLTPFYKNVISDFLLKLEVE
ncbi:MAG: hypothetical protein RQ866_04875, partial [Bacteroidales bacterium]|nr:hypothetical protein [Bacteroidales bacterium]